ncbi:MAG TPA: hypothetical protein VIK81_05255 [Patescibacteria group bacterium]
MTKGIKLRPKKIKSFYTLNAIYFLIFLLFYLIAPRFTNVAFGKIIVITIASYLITIGIYCGFYLNEFPSLGLDTFRPTKGVYAKFMGGIMIVAGILFILMAI